MLGKLYNVLTKPEKGGRTDGRTGPGRVATDSFFKDRGQALRIEALHQVIHQVIAHRRCRRLGGTDRVLIGQVQAGRNERINE